ncbi:MAG: ABC transporter permease [Oscillospiraceae bacterium]|jgi:putative aldouronate transport system permease protein
MRLKDVRRDFVRNWSVYLLSLPVLAYFIIFNYIPMAGIILAFEKFTPKAGVFLSEWVGLKNFINFFGSYYFVRLLKNTFLLSFFDMIFNFPAPIILALLLNEVGNKYFKKVVQTISYMPYFISMVVMAGIVLDFVATDGVITNALASLGIVERKNLLSVSKYFRAIYIGSSMWQFVGYGSIIFLAALSGVDQELYEAARIDGAGRWKQTIHVTLPGIAPTIIVMLILRVGQLMTVGFDKILLLYNPLIYDTSDVIATFTYRKGIQEADYGYATAVGLFNSVVNFALLSITNALSRRFSETSLY